PTAVFEVGGSAVNRLTWTPADFGVPRATIEQLRGGDRQVNCRIAYEVLDGAHGPHRDIVLVNAAAGLVAAGHAPDLRKGVRLAENSIDSRAAWAKVEGLRSFSENYENIPAAGSL